MECPNGFIFGKDWRGHVACMQCEDAFYFACADKWTASRRRHEILNRNFEGIVQ